jgi:hypothetical protein
MYEIKPAYVRGKTLTGVQRRSHRFTEEPVIGKHIIRLGTVTRLADEEYEAYRTRIEQLVAAEAIVVTKVGAEPAKAVQEPTEEEKAAAAAKAAEAQAAADAAKAAEEAAAAELKAKLEAEAQATFVPADALPQPPAEPTPPAPEPTPEVVPAAAPAHAPAHKAAHKKTGR